MKIKEIELQRHKEIHEYLTTTHMFCFFVMLFALALTKQMFSLDYYNITLIRFLLFFVLGFVILILITKYNTKKISLEKGTQLTYTDFVYIGFPLLIAGITFFIVDNNKNHTDAILLLPVIIAASLLGKRAGLVIALIGTLLIYLESIAAGRSSDFFLILESDLILISVMFILAWFIGVRTDMDNKYRHQLTRLASTDLLTGLYNYGYFQEKIVNYVQNSSEKHPLSLIMIDIDYFNHYNDINGHQAGDLLICVVSDILKSTIKDYGFVARYGGDEFVVVLPDTESAKATKVIEEINQVLSKQSFLGERYQPFGKITISTGIAVCPTHATNAKELINYADQALYRAKSLDKNKVEVYYSVFEHLDMQDDEKIILNSIQTLVSVINAKDRYTYGHSERVTEYSIKLAKKIGLNQEEINLLGYAAFLHDIGKIELDWNVLNKKGPLNPEQWEQVKNHSQWGSEIIKAMSKLHPIVPVILYHHENYDGSGYPHGIKGSDIPLLARIIRVVDSYDAMVSHRPYRQNLSVFQALKELKSNAGLQFDPQMVEHFIEVICAENSDIFEVKE
ncbi:MAG: diguanylate cyclase [Syntrophomonadaceae bacterium]|jgi:diguanylate cyclase (GGDEF)-like protein